MASTKQTKRPYTAAEAEKIRKVIDKFYGAGTFDSVNYGNVHAMLDGLIRGGSGQTLTGNDLRSARSAFKIVDGNSG